MNKRTLQLLALSAAALFNQAENPYSVPERKVSKPYTKRNTSSPPRKLHTYNVNGTQIQAYSKKDAIKRYSHQNKEK